MCSFPVSQPCKIDFSWLSQQVSLHLIFPEYYFKIKKKTQTVLRLKYAYNKNNTFRINYETLSLIHWIYLRALTLVERIHLKQNLTIFWQFCVYYYYFWGMLSPFRLVRKIAMYTCKMTVSFWDASMVFLFMSQAYFKKFQSCKLQL